MENTVESEVRDITFNFLRSAASVSPPGGSSTAVPSRPKAVRIVQDRHIVSAKRPAPAVREEPRPVAQPPDFVNIGNIPYRTPQEGLDRQALLPVRPYAFLPPPPWQTSTPPEAPAQRPSKIPRIEVQGEGISNAASSSSITTDIVISPVVNQATNVSSTAASSSVSTFPTFPAQSTEPPTKKAKDLDSLHICGSSRGGF